MIYNLDGLFGIQFSVSQALRTLMGEILALIYSLIEYLYSVFIYLSRAEILENEFIQSIYKKVGLILGLFMVFKLIFSLIQSLLDPNKLTDKKNGFASIIWRSVIAIVLLGVTPTIFREAFKLQNLIVGSDNSNNVIYKLIAGQSNVGNLDNMGRVLASDLYFSFFTDNEDPYLNNGIDDSIPDSDVIYNDINSSDAKIYFDRYSQDNYENLRLRVIDDEMNFSDTVPYLSIKNETKNQYIIEFNWFLLLIVGGFTVWMLFMYCVQVAIRVVQLAYLQLVAPVPILSYIAEPEGSFKKWVNQCLSTFLDLFLRLAIIYFVMTMIGDVLNQFTKMEGIIFETTGIPAEDGMTLAIVKIFIIVGLLLFAKKVPELIKDLFPNLGISSGKFDFGFSPKKVFKDTLVSKAVGGAAGAVAGGVVGVVGGSGFKGRAKGLIGGLSKGAVSGAQGKKISDIVSARAAQNRKNRAMDEAGSTWGGRMDAKMRETFGMRTQVEKIEKEAKAYDKANDNIDKTEIRPRRDRINEINNGRIREINDQQNDIRNNPAFKQKSSNDAVVAAVSAIKEKAKEELLKSNAGVMGATARLEYLNSHHGEIDPTTGRNIDSTMIADQKAQLNAIIDRESEDWINNNLTDETVARNRQVIADQTGQQLSDVSDATSINNAKDNAKNNNQNLATIIASLEYQIQVLDDEKKEQEKIIEDINREISELEKQKENNDREKEKIEKTKKKPQADIDAVKK